MARKLGLPVLGKERFSIGNPTLEHARKRLGGQGNTDALAGAIVRAQAQVEGATVRGVVVFSNEEECDVFTEAGFVKRTRKDKVESASAEVDSPLHELAGEAKVFASLAEGQRVRFDDPQRGPSEGVLFEKCRYGGLVAKDDGTIVAVGFRKLWPAMGAPS